MLPRKLPDSSKYTERSACKSPSTVPSTLITCALMFALTLPSLPMVTRCVWLMLPSIVPWISKSSSADNSPLKRKVGGSTDMRSDAVSYGLLMRGLLGELLRGIMKLFGFTRGGEACATVCFAAFSSKETHHKVFAFDTQSDRRTNKKQCCDANAVRA